MHYKDDERFTRIYKEILEQYEKDLLNYTQNFTSLCHEINVEEYFICDVLSPFIVARTLHHIHTLKNNKTIFIALNYENGEKLHDYLVNDLGYLFSSYAILLQQKPWDENQEPTALSLKESFLSHFGISTKQAPDCAKMIIAVLEKNYWNMICAAANSLYNSLLKLVSFS